MSDEKIFKYDVVIRARVETTYQVGFVISGRNETEARKRALERVTTNESKLPNAEQWEFVSIVPIRQMVLKW